MRLIKILFFFLGLSNSFAFKISGVVKDDNGPLSFANISIANSTKGSICDNRGRFSINLEQGNHTLICSYLGYDNDTLNVDIQEDKVLSFTLRKSPVKLSELNIYSDQENPAIEMIRNLISFKDSFPIPDQFVCNSYVKSNIEDGFTKASRQAINLNESYSELHRNPYGYQEIILKQNDFTEKNNFQGVPQLSNVSSFYLSSFTPVNPDIYFKSHDEVILDWSDNQINLPRLNENSFISPLAKHALRKYDFEYQESFYNELNEEIAVIKYHPKKGKEQCFSGRLFINNTKHYLIKIEFEIPSSSLMYYNRFIVSYENELIANYLVPKEILIQYSFKGPITGKTGNSFIFYSNYEIPGKVISIKKNIISIEKADSTIDFNKLRPFKLSKEEEKFLKLKTQELDYQNSETYKDSIDQILRKASFQNLFAQGITWRNRKKKNEFHLHPMGNSIQLLSFGGLRIQSSAYFKHTFHNDQAFKISSALSYGFNLNDLKWINRVDFTYSPKNFGRVFISAGDNYDFLSYNQSFSAVFSGANFIERKHLGIGHNYELLNGLYWETELSYQSVTSAADLDAGDWRDNIFPDNDAINFDPFQQLNWKNNLIIRFGQKYRLKGNKKIIIGSKFPEIKLTYLRSFPIQNISSSRFIYFQIQVQDDKKWKKLGTTRYTGQFGSFLNKEGLKVNNLKFFRGGDDWLLSNTLTTFQLINREGYQTSNNFIQAHAIHHFDGFISQKIPGFKKLKSHIFLGANLLMVQNEIDNHIENYIGLEKSITLSKQNYRFSISFHHSPNSSFNMNNYVKVGIDWYNLLTNKWIN